MGVWGGVGLRWREDPLLLLVELPLLWGEFVGDGFSLISGGLVDDEVISILERERERERVVEREKGFVLWVLGGEEEKRGEV